MVAVILTKRLGQNKAELQPNAGSTGGEAIPVCVNGATASPCTSLCRSDKGSFKYSHRRFNGLVILESLAFVAAISKQVQPSPAAADFHRSSVHPIARNKNKEQKSCRMKRLEGRETTEAAQLFL